MEQYADVQQLMKKGNGQNRKPVYPTTVIQAVFDGKTGASLEAILAQFNSVYVQYQGTPKATRLIIPKEMRRAGLTITYMDMDSNTITERANSAVQKDNDHWGLDVNWSRVDELSLSGDISVSAKGTWIINGKDTGVKALGPKGDTGLTPWLKTIDNKLHFSYDNVTWEPCSENIAAWFRWSGNKIQISRDNKTWTDLSGKFADNVHIKGYVATYANLPSGAAQGDIYGVGPTYAESDTAHTNPIYRYYVRNANSWVDNGTFTSIQAGIVQETGDSETEVMSQKAVSTKLSELGSHGLYAYFNNYLKPTFSRTEGVLEITLPRQIRIYQYSGEIVVEKDLSTTQYTISAFKKLVINSKSKEVSVKDFTDKSDYDIVLIACVSGDRYTGLLYPYMIADTDSEIIGNLSSLKLDELINTRYTNGYLYGNTNVIDNCSIYQSGAFVLQEGYMVTADFIDVPKNRKILWVHGRTTQQSGIGCVAEYDSDGNFLSYWTMTGEKYRLFELYDENTTKIKATFIKGAHPLGLYEEDGTPLFIPVLDSVDERLNVLDGEIKSLQNVVVETDMFCKASWDNYSDEVFHLEAGVQYNVFFTPDKDVTNLANNDSITDGYCNVKIADANTLDTLKKIQPIYKLEAGKTIDITYTPDEDIDVKVGCYTKNMSSDFKQGVIIKKVEKEDNVDVNNATDIVSYYSSNVIREQSNILKDSDFRCFFFSDVHDSATNVKRIFELANDFGDGRIDCIVNTGDTVSSVMNTGLEWYNSLVDKCNISILHTPGNHDCWKNSNWNWASGKDVYSFIIDKVVSSNVGIMQPSNAAANGLCYYYKDFGNVRVISILSIATSSSDYYFDDAQKEWLASVLESARTTYHYWKIQSNKPTAYSLKSGDVITATLVNDADLNNYQHTHYKEGGIYAVPMSVIIMNHCPFMKDKAVRVQSNKINSWMDYTKGCFSKGVNFDALSLSNEAVSVVDNYIKNGGSFICWLTGHTHIDAVLTHSDSKKQLMININSAKYSNKEDGVPAESIAEPNYDSFDYIGVDLKSAQIKVLRMGYAEDSSMRVRRSWCYDYANSFLISEN